MAHFFQLFLVSGIPLQPGQRGEHGKEQIELCMFFDVGLNEKCGLLRVKSHGNPVHDNFIGAFPDDSRIGIITGQRMPVCNKIETLKLFLKFFPVEQCTAQMTEMQFTGGSHTAYDFPFCHSLLFPFPFFIAGCLIPYYSLNYLLRGFALDDIWAEISKFPLNKLYFIFFFLCQLVQPGFQEPFKNFFKDGARFKPHL